MLKSLDALSVPKLHSIFAISQRMSRNDLMSINNNNNNNMLQDTKNVDYLTQILRITSDFVNQMQYCGTNGLPPSSAMLIDCKTKMSKIAGEILNTRAANLQQMNVTDSSGDVPTIQYDTEDQQRALLTTIRNSMGSNEVMQQQQMQFDFPTLAMTNNDNTQNKQNIQPQSQSKAVYLNIDYERIKRELCIKKDTPTEDQTSYEYIFYIRIYPIIMI